MTTKTCLECKKTLPVSKFHKSKDGRHSRCKACRNKYLRETRKRKRHGKLEEIERGAVDLFIASSRIGGANIPHSSELLEVLMEYFGGVRGFANAYMKQFYDAPVGGAFRTKMLDSLVRLVVGNTAMGGAKKPLELMSEEELEAELRRQVMEAAFQLRRSEDGVRKLQVVEADRCEPGGVPPVPAEVGDGAALRVARDGPH
jgi:hypothetical protein